MTAAGYAMHPATSQAHDGRTVVVVTGAIDVTNAEDFAAELNDLPGPRPAIVDLTRLDYLDSDGLAVLDPMLADGTIVIVLPAESPLRAAADLVGLPSYERIDLVP